MSVGESLKAFYLMGGELVGMSIGSTLHGSLKSSIFVARQAAVSISISFSCVYFF